MRDHGVRLLGMWLACAAIACGQSPPEGPTNPSPQPANAPPPSAGHSLVYASHLGMVILTNVGLGGGPGARYLTDLAYDERRNVVVLFGGDGPSGLLGDTWEFDGVTWRQIRPRAAGLDVIAPSPLFATRLA
jgi:hypothetical protein